MKETLSETVAELIRLAMKIMTIVLILKRMYYT